MDVKIKKFDVAMNVKAKGIELDVCRPNGDHIGDLVVTMTKLIWCEGRTSRAKGKKIKWQKFIDYMNSL